MDQTIAQQKAGTVSYCLGFLRSTVASIIVVTLWLAVLDTAVTADAAPASASSFVVESPPSFRGLELCDLPPCSLVNKSRLHSPRCGTAPEGWPLLITGTPRSATVYTFRTLREHGLQVQDDWRPPQPDGYVSWIFAFEDPDNFGPARTGGKTFRSVLHQVKEPLGSITSMCTESVLKKQLEFLRRHVDLRRSFEHPAHKSRAVLEFWIEWRTYLNEMKFPTYRIEDVHPRDIFTFAGLGSRYRNKTKNIIKSTTNSRRHRPRFSWREIYTIDPENAAKAWAMAHEYGYTYKDVNFDELTCLDSLPLCDGTNVTVSPTQCPPGTHPFPSNGTTIRDYLTDRLAGGEILGTEKSIAAKGWVHGGCTEYRTSNGTFVGLTGPIVDRFNRSAINDAVENLLAERWQRGPLVGGDRDGVKGERIVYPTATMLSVQSMSWYTILLLGAPTCFVAMRFGKFNRGHEYRAF